MTITADTPISSLMNSEKVSSLCEQLSARVESFKETTTTTLSNEMTAGLSRENCLVDDQALLEDEGTNTLACINGIDTSTISKVVAEAKIKRTEELILLKFKVTIRIHSLRKLKSALESKEELLPEEIQRLTAIINELDKYENKLDDINAEIGSV